MAYGPAPESDKQARDWLAKHGAEFELFAGGSWVKPASGEWFDVINPATTQRIARVPQAGKADVDAAVAAARAAFRGWSGLPGHARARYLYALAREVQRRSEEHTSELQSPCNLVCRLLLEKKKKKNKTEIVKKKTQLKKISSNIKK